MQIAKDKVVTIDYTLTDGQGTLLDSSQDREPLSYIQGAGSIIPGLEAALEGKSSGEALQVTIAPDQAYGERDESLMQAVSRDLFEGAEQLEARMRFRVQSDFGMQIITVVGVEGDTITIDGNHPLAGVTLNFDVTIRDVRDATGEELSHGHVHGPEAHGH
jgi:FKBP-type peptidyl-prolyl cis-trans isomerase SlyD